ncbi:MAG: hypothetical protein U9N42_06165 [Campylobacterota bacterium]|nr:hypothetical protein [Campylobacterota bacterium]
MSNYQRLIKDCFWDLNVSDDYIEKILCENDFRKKDFLFNKILLNSTRLFEDLLIFTKTDLKLLLQKCKIPRLNAEYISRRKNLAEVYFFDMPLKIDELKWVS